MQKIVMGVVAGVLLAAGISATTALSQSSSSPASPSPSALAPSGIIIQHFPGHASFGLSVAEQKAHAAFPRLPATTSMTGELVLFHNTNVFSLQKPQPAWLITWDETSRPPLRPGAGQTVPTYTHMNVLISATTGQTLEIFPSP